MSVRLVQSDAEARRQICTSLDESLLVEAAAGTGKTTMLVQRLVEVLASGRTTVNRIMAVTFTRKAAGELKLRLRQALDEALGRETDEGRRDRLQDAIARLEEALVGTIHSLCAEILRQRPVEAKIDPDFREIDDDEASRLFGQAFRGWIERRLETPPEGLRRALSRLAHQRSRDGAGPVQRLRQEAESLRDWRDYPREWETRPFDRDAAIDAALERVEEAAQLYRGCKDSRDPLRQALAPAEGLDTWVRRSEEVSGRRDHDALEARLIETLRDLRKKRRNKGQGSWPVEGLSRKEVQRRRDALIEALEQLATEAGADLAARLRSELQEVLDAYETLKRRTGSLDFLDLLLEARDLLRGDESVRRHFQNAYSHVFVDEFQDTDPLQVELVLLLASDDPEIDDWRQTRPTHGKLFLVGDPKQSIYRFRRADVVLYQDVKEQLASAGVSVVHLTTSFRSVRPLQATVNAAFAGEMQLDRQAGQAQYVPLDPHRPAIDSQPAVVTVPIARPFGAYRVTAKAVEEGQPPAVAAFLQWLLQESDWTVPDPEDPERQARTRVEPSHVAILFRRFRSFGQDVTRPYLAELEARGIPHLLSGGRSFHEREEVETLRAALTAIEWPEDELSVFATLRGGLFAIPDAALLRFRNEVGRLHPFRSAPAELDDALQPAAAALALLAELHRRRNRVPIAQTLAELLRVTRAHAGFAMRPAGNQVLANVQRVLDLARAFELSGGLSFRGFVQRLAEEAERPGSAETPVLEEGAEGVRLMTVHGAKGLEFPVVVLADITARLTSWAPSATIDAERGLAARRLLGCAPWELVESRDRESARDRSEGVRIAYVAATRARDLLILPGVGENPWEDGWTSPLNRAIYPAREHYRHSRPAAGCPAFGDRTVLERAMPAPGDAETSIQPGQHESASGTPVVWWDPALLHLEVPRNFGIRQEALLTADEEGDAEQQEMAALRAWEQARRGALRGARRPACEVIVVSETDERPEVQAEVTLQRVQHTATRPGGRRFGTLVHTILRDVGLGADEAEIAGLATLHARTLGAPPDEHAAAVASVAATLAHPVVLAAAAAEECVRELPITLRLQDGRYVEGAIDLAYRDGDRWTVVDFKTDSRVQEMTERYRNQVLWYVLALRQLRGGDAEAVLLAI